MVSINKQVVLNDGTEVLIRSVRRVNRECYLKGFQQLSERSRYFRFFSNQRSLSEKQLQYFTEIDNIYQLALCAIDVSGKNMVGIGMARCFRTKRDPDLAEFTITVIDAYQHRGLGTLLFNIMIQTAQRNGIQKIFGYVLPENEVMLRLLRRFGATVQLERGPMFRVELDLKAMEPAICFQQLPS